MHVCLQCWCDVIPFVYKIFPLRGYWSRGVSDVIPGWVCKPEFANTRVDFVRTAVVSSCGGIVECLNVSGLINLTHMQIRSEGKGQSDCGIGKVQYNYLFSVSAKCSKPADRMPVCSELSRLWDSEVQRWID